MPEKLQVVGAAIVDGNRCLVARRGPGMTFTGKWEFPGGKVEPRERARAALAREIEEELGVEIAVGEWLGRGEVIDSARSVRLDVYAASLVRGTPHPREHSEIRWVGASELGSLDWAAADVPVLPAVRSFLAAGTPRLGGIA